MAEVASLPVVRVASEFSNVAEAFALRARLPNYRVQPVWGSAGAYPPEDADLAILAVEDERDLAGSGLTLLHRLIETSAGLIGNERSIKTKRLGEVLALLGSIAREPAGDGFTLPVPQAIRTRTVVNGRRHGLRLAVPDGHQQKHVVQALTAAGLQFEGYNESECVRRPSTEIEGLEVKVVRPHDMPQLVALGQFDLAITGRDCLMEHKYRFPSSPAIELVDLQRGQYNLCAVVTEDMAAEAIEPALEHWREAGKPFVRIASEFPATADYYARSRHIWRYQVIPISGASEGFVPEDAELLIEGTETGKTLKENRLKSIDLLYRSTTCVIGHESPHDDHRLDRLRTELLGALSRSAGHA
jgi:ATP phosphoribosyltransferase